MTGKANGYVRMRLCAGLAVSLLGRICMHVILALLPAASGCASATDQATTQIFVRELNGKTLNLTEMLYDGENIVDPATGKPISHLGGKQAGMLGGEPRRLQFHEGVCSARPFGDGWMDATGRLVARGVWGEWAEWAALREGRAIVPGEGMIDRDGRYVVPCGRYEKLGEISEGRCAFRVGNRWGFLDLVGNEVIPPKFGSHRSRDWPPSFHDGFAAVVDESEGLVYIDKAGDIAIRPPDMCIAIYDFSEGVARIEVLDTEEVTEEVIAKVRAYRKEGLKDVFVSGKQWWCGNYGIKTGYLSVSGRMAIPLSRRGSYEFAGGLALAYEYVDDGLGAKKPLYGYINVSGDWAIRPKFERAEFFFSEGLACVKFNGLWGYVDVRGEFAIEPKYARAENFKDGTAVVWTWTAEEGKQGYCVHFIDRKGKTILVAKKDYIPIDLD